MNIKERKTLHNLNCPECREQLFCEFSDDELRRNSIAGTLSFVCSNGNAHASSSDNYWSRTRRQKRERFRKGVVVQLSDSAGMVYSFQTGRNLYLPNCHSPNSAQFEASLCSMCR